MDSRLYWIWLQQALGYGSIWLTPLLNRFSSPEGVFAAERPALESLRLPPSVLARLCRKSLDVAQSIFQKVTTHGDWLLTPHDQAYPALLRGIAAPPAVLYGRGEWPDLSLRPAIAVVGTRYLTRYGYEVTGQMAAGLARGGAILISGGAEGGDAAATNAAMDVGGVTVTIQACGLDVNYPAVNEPLRRRILQERGVLLSEFAYGQRVKQGAFHIRNRLLSGMANGVCVTEAPESSGALITARYAREQGRDVFAVPGALGAPNSVGTNALIQRGAKLVSSADEILEEYRSQFSHILDMEAAKAAIEKRKRPASTVVKVAQLPPVSHTAKTVLAALEAQPLPADEIAAKTALTVGEVLAALTELELCGLAVSQAGQQYRRT